MDTGVEFAICRTMADEMEAYLLAHQLFRQIVVHTPVGDLQPKMTLGAFIDHYRRLRRRQSALSATQQAELDRIGETWATMKRRYEGRYEELLHQELRSHLDSWNWFLDDCLRQPNRCQEDYPAEVHARARIALLLEELGPQAETHAEASRVSMLDDRLRRLWQKGRFIWPGEAADAYPPDRYWFLYGYPQGADEDD